MIVRVIFYILISIITIIILTDLVAVLKSWFGRIHIGRYNNRLNWNKAVINIVSKWLIKTPKARINDNTRLIIIDKLRRINFKDDTHYWQEAALLLGYTEYLKFNKDEKLKKIVTKYLRNKFDDNGQWKTKPTYVEAAMLAYAVMKLDSLHIDKYKPALDYIWNLIREHIGQDNTVLYRKSLKQVRFVDTIGFICPFLVAYGLKYDNEECVELAVRQIQQYERYGMAPRYNIPCHAVNIENKMHLGIYGWGRGAAWFAIGLADAWNEMTPKSKYKAILEESVKKFAFDILKFQNENGAWTWNIPIKEEIPDSSATAVLGWFLVSASHIDDISEKCIEGSQRAINYLMKVTRRNGIVDFSQGDTKGIGVYLHVFDILPFTQGFAARLINLFLNKHRNHEKIEGTLKI